MSESKRSDQISFIRENVPMPAIFENAAEECAELAHALLKHAMACRMENPTPVPKRDSYEACIEELSDLMVLTDIIGMQPSRKMQDEKINRMMLRIMQSDGGNAFTKGVML